MAGSNPDEIGLQSWDRCDNAEEFAFSHYNLERRNSTVDINPFPSDHSDDESPFSSLPDDDGRELNSFTEKYMDLCFNELSISTRPGKEKKFKYREIPSKQDKQVRCKGGRRHSSAVIGTTELLLKADELDAANTRMKTSGKGRKRSFVLARTLERDTKLKLNHIIPASPEILVMEMASQTSTAPPQESLKIGCTSHFRSLKSKPVAAKDTARTSGIITPVKTLTLDCPRDRSEFYLIFSTLIRMGNGDRKATDDVNATRPVRILNQQKSHEDLVWQNKLNDLLWLELRAWHHSLTVEEEDQILCQEREAIENVLNKVIQFQFNPITIEGEIKKQFEERTSNVEENDEKPLKLNVNLKPSTNFSDAGEMNLMQTYPCNGYCSVFCVTCIANQNEALRQVKQVLDELDSVESLYPSSRAMTKEWVKYKDAHFISNVQTMCLFWNLVTDLRQKIETLGKMLSSLGGENLPWPNFKCLSQCSEKVDGDAVEAVCPQVTVTLEPDDKRERKSSKCVRFSHELKTGSSTSSADSGIHSTHESSSPSTTPLPSISSPRYGVVNPWTFDMATSTPVSNKSVLCHSFSEGSLDTSFVSPYRRYVDKVLKQKGLKKLLMRLMGLIQDTLHRAKHALKRQSGPFSPDVTYVHYPESKPHKCRDECIYHHSDPSEELSDLFGPWSYHYQSMKLPTFRALYIFLLQIPIEIMHECVQLRLEQLPEEPSMLSIRQLMRECKETIKAAVIIRLKYVKMNQVVLFKNELEKLDQDLIDYDDNVKKMFESYLRYLQSWVKMLLKSTQQTEKNVLEEEWSFVKAFSRYVPRGETLASEIFCSLASLMLDSAGSYLDNGLDYSTTQLYDRMFGADTSQRARANVLQSCRDYKDVFHETRKRALKAMAFAKMLRKDLEIAAEFDVTVNPNQLLEKLQSTDHILLVAPHSSTFFIFIPVHIKDNLPYLYQLLSMTYGHEHSAAPDNIENEGYLVILSCDRFGIQLDNWKGEKLMIEATAEITITLTHLKVEVMLFVVNHSSQMKVQRKLFQKAMGSCVSITKEYTTCNQSIADSLCDVKKEAMTLKDKISDAINNVEEKLNLDTNCDLEDAEKSSLQARCREILYQCYKFGFEYHKEMTYLVTGEARSRLGLGLVQFAKQWMKFVIEKCERGRGVRPRWANQGLEFLITACEPQYIKLLSDEEFLNLKLEMNTCITHLIGSPDSKTSIGSRPGSRPHSPTPHSRPGSFRYSHSIIDLPKSVISCCRTDSCNNHTRNDLNSSIDESPFLADRQKSHDETLDETCSTFSDPQSPIEHVQEAIKIIEYNREVKLQNDGVIGKVIDKVAETLVHINARRVTFKWQRGIKLGQGRFGKVYTAVNSSTGELMALKEIHLQLNDHKTIKEVAAELKIFEGIRNPYLVRYYGVEIHREEMFIFMEYCENGTLEHALQLALPEPQIRKYTRQLLLAVSVLHEHTIVHRDIKAANIFLTSEGSLKLGDFGCCIKLKNHTTMPGELNSFVGTQAYMAPEVFTKTSTEGQGRASDIWSVGCVVVEMAQGKRPWYELENHYQIMYKVGMGETPEIPDNLSEEGHDFLNCCFKFQPKERSTAIELLGHPFTKVYSEEECQSLPYICS
ncbi:Mitogen-activated protein kinase kinase kinase 4 [Chamberlinius hualienensis]